MIKLVKFNLLIDGQRCRMIEDLRNNFNLLDVMEEFQNGKLEKWLKVRNFAEQFELVKAIDKNSALQFIAQQLCNIFDVTIVANDLTNELMVIEYQKLTQEQKENQEAVKQIFDEYYQENIKKLFSNKAYFVKKITFAQETASTDFIELFSNNIPVIVLGHYLTNSKGAFGGFTSGTLCHYKDAQRTINVVSHVASFNISPSLYLFDGLLMRFEKKNSKYDAMILYIIDIDDKLNTKTVKNATIELLK